MTFSSLKQSQRVSDSLRVSGGLPVVRRDRGLGQPLFHVGEVPRHLRGGRGHVDHWEEIKGDQINHDD